MEITESRKMPCISNHSQSFIHKKLSPSENVFDFLNVLKLLNVLENFPAISEILVPIRKKGGEKLICLCDYA